MVGNVVLIPLSLVLLSSLSFKSRTSYTLAVALEKSESFQCLVSLHVVHNEVIAIWHV